MNYDMKLEMKIVRDLTIAYSIKGQRYMIWS